MLEEGRHERGVQAAVSAVDGSQCIPKGDTVQVPGGRNAVF